MKKYLIGIDEVGRGPIAGPVSVGIVMIEKRRAKGILKKFLGAGLYDSKQVSEVKRGRIFEMAGECVAAEGRDAFTFIICSITPKQIDKNGISHSIRTAIKKGLQKLSADPEISDIKLDGLLKAPPEFKYQETIIKGDTKEPTIMLASVLAKVHRDNLMCKLSKKYPEYFFHKHKGYGTKLHYESIKKHGISDIHRKTYVRFLEK